MSCGRLRLTFVSAQDISIFYTCKYLEGEESGRNVKVKVRRVSVCRIRGVGILILIRLFVVCRSVYEGLFACMHIFVVLVVHLKLRSRLSICVRASQRG